MSINIKYLGHSAFFIKTPTAGILIDPFISQNPVANFDYTKEKITHIFVTHAHSDHLGDGILISKNTGAKLVAVFELANYCAQRGANAIGVGLGGKLDFDFGYSIFTPAFHSSSTPDGTYAGCPASICLNIDAKKIFHAGDTCLTQEFKTVEEFFAPEIAMLPIGATFTMGAEEASIAAKWLKSKIIIPMHYNTFPPVKADVNKFKSLVDNDNQKVLILSPNQEFEI